MKLRRYSKYDMIPKGRASDKITEGCLVLEGGAFRGLYNQGVMDAWMRHGINLSCVIGVSAGALAGLNYVSGQIGRSARVNLGYRRSSEYVGTKALRKSHSILSIDFLLDTYDKIEPLDRERFFSDRQRYIAVATNCITGQTAYFEKGHCSDIMSAIKASASMPYISPMVYIDNVPYLDGGCSCKIPYEWALDQNYKKIVIIKTRERGYRKKESDSTRPAVIYKNYPEFADSLVASNYRYNRQCDEIDWLEASGRIFAVAPSEHVEVSRIDGDMERLGHLYRLGYYDGYSSIGALREYLQDDQNNP